MGEPAGTSPEIITRTLRGLVRDPEAAVIVTGDDGIFRRLASDIDLPLPFTFYAESHDELSKAEEDGERVFHKDGEEPCFRPTPDSAVRYSYQIPVEEAVCCLQFILEREKRIITKSELSKLFKAELGYDRMGSQVDALFRKAAKSSSLKRTGNGRFTI